MSRYCKHGCDPRNCYECSSERTALGPSDVTACSPSSLTPETDALRDSYENYEHRTNTEDLWELCASMERERNELAGYLCRVKLPLPVRFVANLADVFPGENIRMKDEGGHLCIFSENDERTRGANKA